MTFNNNICLVQQFGIAPFIRIDHRVSDIICNFLPVKAVHFTTALKKFGSNGEKTGWVYIEVPAPLAAQLKPGSKKSFKVKGSLDKYKITGVSLLPMGSGNFIMAVNAAMRKAIAKRTGAMVEVSLSEDKKEYKLNKDFMECLADDEPAMAFFKTLARSHQNYFSKWIDSAKTEPTKVKRISRAIFGLANKMKYNQMLQVHKSK